MSRKEPDLSGLKPTTQEVIKGWIKDGTFIERAIGAMQEQEAENMRLEKALAEQPAQQEPVYVQTRHKEEHGFSEWGSLLDPTHRNSKWAEGVEMRLLYTSPPAQRKPLTFSRLCEIEEAITDKNGDVSFVQFARAIEAAHGIKE